jgi:WD40 repeat protein
MHSMIDPEDPDHAVRLVFSSDGRTLVSGSSGYGVRLWDVETGALRQVLRPPADCVSSVAISSDGTMLAAGGHYREMIWVWDLRVGEVLFTLEGHGGNIRGVHFSPDGRRIVSGSEDASVKVWDARSGRLIATLLLLPPTVGGTPDDWIAYTPDGYYHSSPGAGCWMRWSVGTELHTAETYADVYCRPEEIASRLH